MSDSRVYMQIPSENASNSGTVKEGSIALGLAYELRASKSVTD